MLGQNQECYGACFSPSQALDGSMAAVRVWDRVLSQASHPCCVAFSCTPMSARCLSDQSTSRACEEADNYLCLDIVNSYREGTLLLWCATRTKDQCSVHAGGYGEPDLVGVSQAEVKGNMYKEQPSDDGGLTAIYTFQSSDISKATNGKVITAITTAIVQV